MPRAVGGQQPWSASGPMQQPQTGPMPRAGFGPMPRAVGGPPRQSDFDAQSDFGRQPGRHGQPRGGMNNGGMNNAGMNNAGMNNAGMNNAGMNNAGMNNGQAPWEGGFPEPDPDFMYREPGPGMPGYRGSRDHRYGGDVR
jgi:hypothetical protein